MSDRRQRLLARRDLWAVLAVVVASVLLLVLPKGYQSPYAQPVERALGRVLETDDSLIQQFGIIKAGEQTVLVHITQGRFRGQEVLATNQLLGKMETDKMFTVGDRVYLVLTVDGGEITMATAYDHYRLDVEALLVGAFALFLIIFAGWSGVRALFSFGFAVTVMWKVLLPSILKGYDPILIAVLVVMMLATVTLLLVAGINRTAWVALAGAGLGLFLSVGLAFVLFPLFKLHGAILPFSETLLYTGYDHLNLTRLFMAAIFVGASGAVIDVAIDVSTAMQEVAARRPDLSARELIRSGFSVGRNMTATMVTTLLMAYAASYMALLMVFMAQGVPPLNLLNTNYVAAEVLKTVVGSFGLVTVAPFTAIVGGIIFTRGSHV